MSSHHQHSHHTDPNIQFAHIIDDLLKTPEFEVYKDTDSFKAISRIVENVIEDGSSLHDLRMNEVAQRLRVSVSFARKLCDTGKLKSYRVGRERRVTKEELEKYLKERKAKTRKIIDEMVEEAQDLNTY